MNNDKETRKFINGDFKRQDSGGRNMEKFISELERKLRESITPETIHGLNSFERRLIHRHFDHNPDVQTRTYRDGSEFTLFVYPVGNIERFARKKAQEALESDDPIALPPMGNYERYIVHSSLKDVGGIETQSQGDGSERHVQIVSKKFGRGLKKIVKKIRLL